MGTKSDPRQFEDEVSRTLEDTWNVPVYVSVFSSLYLVRMRENTDQINSEHGHFSGSEYS